MMNHVFSSAVFPTRHRAKMGTRYYGLVTSVAPKGYTNGLLRRNVQRCEREHIYNTTGHSEDRKHSNGLMP